MMPLELVEVAPSGERQARGFVDYANRPGEFAEWTEKVYPAPDLDVRALRLELDLNLREAARILGISASDLSALERGSKGTDWIELERQLRGGARR